MVLVTVFALMDTTRRIIFAIRDKFAQLIAPENLMEAANAMSDILNMVIFVLDVLKTLFGIKSTRIALSFADKILFMMKKSKVVFAQMDSDSKTTTVKPVH